MRRRSREPNRAPMAAMNGECSCRESECDYDPREIPLGTPTGMFHCPDCGEMVIAGMEHGKDVDSVLDCAVHGIEAYERNGA